MTARGMEKNDARKVKERDYKRNTQRIKRVKTRKSKIRKRIRGQGKEKEEQEQERIEVEKSTKN